MDIQHRNNTTSSTYADTARKPSPQIWSHCPWDKLANPRAPGRSGIAFYDDFVDWPLQPSLATQVGTGKYKAFGDSGNTITRVMSINSALVPGGALQVALDTNNDQVTLAQSYPSFLLTGLASNSGRLWFECCYSQNSIATNMASVFIGLAEVDQWTLSSSVPWDDAGAFTGTNAAAIGFRIDEDALGVIDTVRTDRASAITNIGDDEAGTITAYTFRKLGMFYDPKDANRCVRFFANGVELATALTRAQLTALTYLDAGGLGLIWASNADTAATSFQGYMKWWACAQELPN